MSGHVLKDFLHNHQTMGRWERLRRLVTPQDTLGIILYGEPDPDSLAAAWALRHLFRPRAHAVEIVAQQPVRRAQNVRFFNVLKIPLKVVDEIPWQAYTKLALVDAQPDFFQPAPAVPFDIVIDHHPKRAKCQARFADIRVSYGSTCTILLEYILCAGDMLPKRLATALWYGLWIDTDKLTRAVSAQDMAAISYLYRKADAETLRWLEQTQIPGAYRPLYQLGLDTLAQDEKRALVFLGDIPQPDACVHVADFLSRFGGVRWVATAGVFEQKLYVILRSGMYGVNVGRIARQKLGAFGSAGGHLDKARAEIPLAGLAETLHTEPTLAHLDAWLHSVLLPRRARTATRETPRRHPK
ncbi:MAG: DHH family phosphoesterase [bacterium]|nr:DHH family phosphoesterase [bacterium]